MELRHPETRKTIARDALTMRRLRKFIHLSLFALDRDRRRLALTVLLAVASGALQTILFFLLAMIAMSLAGPSRRPQLTSTLNIDPHLPAFWLVVAAIAVVAALMALTLPQASLQSKIASRAVSHARERLIRGYLRSSFEYRSRQPDGFLQQAVGEYCQNLAVSVQQFLGFCVATVTLVMLIMGPMFLNPKVALMEIATIMVSFALLLVLTLVLRLRNRSGNRARINRELGLQSAEIGRMADDIQTFHVADTVIESMSTRISTAAEALRHLHYRDIALPAAYQYAALLIILVAVGLLVLVYPGQHPSLAVSALLMVRVLIYARQMLATAQQGGSLAPYVEMIEREAKALEENEADRRGTRTVEFDGIRLDRLSFSYPGCSSILHEVTAWLRPGEAVGLVGPSGEGKSTICALLVGLRPPNSGDVTIAGVSLSKIDPATLASTLAYVPQDPRLLASSVAENICFFRPGYDRTAIQDAARAAHIHEEICKLPQGYDTVVGPGGHGLSGGQRQRIVIARALLGKPRLLVLDEPSSALDEQSERMVAQTLSDLKGTTAIVMVTHRTSALSICDRLWRLENGKLTEVGMGAMAI